MPRFRSKNERVVYDVLKGLFPMTPIVNELPVGEHLHVDFLVRGTITFAVEVDGETHFGYCPKFHESPADFERQRIKDRHKDEILEERGVPLLRLDVRGGADSDEVRSAILDFIGGLEPQDSPQNPTASPYQRRSKEQQRSFRKQMYQLMKERKARYGR